MLTEPELIQYQRVLLRQVRTANQVRVNTEATITDLHQVCLNAQQEAQQTLYKADLAKLLLNVIPETPKKSEAALPALKHAADLAVSTQKLIEMLAQALAIARSDAVLRRRWLGVSLAVVILIVLYIIGLQMEQIYTIRSAQATATAQVVASQATATAQVVASQATVTAQAIELQSAQATATAQSAEAQAQLERQFRTLLDAGGWINSIDDVLYVYVPAGKFKMGSERGDNDAQPVHTVTLDDYWIMRTEVTNAQYVLCVTAGACTATGNNSLLRNPTYAEHSVTYVNWEQASMYCTWSETRLPTEAEWEKAARGTDDRTYPWGNTVPTRTLANVASYVGNTMAVGSYPDGASPYGALDMAGNVWEWVNDGYYSDYYAQSPVRNPQGPSISDSHVQRGGSWSNSVDFVHSAFRLHRIPAFRSHNVGFRCVRSP